MTVGLAGALLAAVAYGAATILQAIAVRRMAAVPGGSPLTVRARAGWLYAVGLGLDGLGFVASVAALRTLPLFLVESAVASSVAVTALLSVLVLGVRLRVAEMVALAAVAAGLVGLALAAEEGPASPVGTAATWWLFAGTVAVAGLLALGLRDGRGARSAVVLSVAAGLAFGLVGIAARLLVVPPSWWGLLTMPVVWVLLAQAGLATVAYGYALARGRVTTVAALTFVTETVVPAVIGVAVLGDRVQAGRWPLAAAAFALTLVGCVALAGRAEPAEPAEPGEQSEPTEAPLPGAQS
ncbi:MAG: hypothetical protein JWP82_751, partial [Humibacillus sp.]|nr:hypothetical protein [Humibacillus sp.]